MKLDKDLRQQVKDGLITRTEAVKFQKKRNKKETTFDTAFKVFSTTRK